MWEIHGTEGWYIGPQMQGYIVCRLYMPKTCVERILDTVEFSPQFQKVMYILASDAISKSVFNIGKFIEKPTPAATFETLGNRKLAALQKFAEMFRGLTETDSVTDVTLRVESEKTEYKSERLIRSNCLNPNTELKQTKTSWGKAKVAPIHTKDPTEQNKHSVEEIST